MKMSSVNTPTFVGDSYYCELGNAVNSIQFFSNDPLWDGMECNNLESTCCTRSNMPWFNTVLSETTSDDIELRLVFFYTD